ncbi:MAG: hypothetical protein SOZ05_08645, partial [Muribaculaceae bacterium]|nr:hypothetical protein [Muribaculaceae bacterium]
STKDRGSKKESKWSKSFKSENGEDEFDTIQRIFGLSESARGLFEAATGGNGNEKQKILTLHSSSLLAFLCFNDVANHPITITISDDKTVYDEVMFEVKNNVINESGTPSNIDVLLMGENRKKLLFLESKFTEYLSGGKVTLSPHRYKEFYSKLTKKFDCPFSAGYVTVNSKTDKSQKTQYALYKGKKTSQYLEGIKQAFSHLLGIATGPAKNQTKGNEDYTRSLLENADEIKFASIVFNCDNDKFKEYDDLYKSVFENSDVITDTIKDVLKKRELKLTIVPKLLQYQEVFQANNLSDEVRNFYNKVNDSKIRFSNGK